MKNWKTVEIPAKMQGLEKDPRGFPIPYVVLRDNNGKAHFQINDTHLAIECITKRICPICGGELHEDMWLIGGPLSALHPNGAYIDSAVHHECGTYALQACPYLAVTRYNKRLDLKTLTTQNFEGIAFLDPTMIEARPPVFMMVHITGFSLTERMYIVPHRPYLKVEFWNEGEILTHDKGYNILTEEGIINEIIKTLEP